MPLYTARFELTQDAATPTDALKQAREQLRGQGSVAYRCTITDDRTHDDVAIQILTPARQVLAEGRERYRYLSRLDVTLGVDADSEQVADALLEGVVLTIGATGQPITDGTVTISSVAVTGEPVPLPPAATAANSTHHDH